MSKSRISIIAAIDEKRGLGKNNDLLFKIPEDMKRLRQITTGHPLVMGRKTFESLGRLLPDRTHIVITHDPKRLKHLTYQPESSHRFKKELKLQKTQKEQAKFLFSEEGKSLTKQSGKISLTVYTSQ
jgi:dihydrofolate reductase